MLQPLGLLLWGLLALRAEAYDNGVGALPQMGLNSWNSVGGGVSGGGTFLKDFHKICVTASFTVGVPHNQIPR